MSSNLGSFNKEHRFWLDWGLGLMERLLIANTQPLSRTSLAPPGNGNSSHVAVGSSRY